jgi:DNA or RNA helicases of superfamily II
MTREDILTEILCLEGSNWLLELATGTGKSKMALSKIWTTYKRMGKPANASLLIVVPRNVHKGNWEDEIKKWWPTGFALNITYTTYVSFPKHKGDWNFAIFDECHHLSERCREALCDFNIGHSVLCSATVSKSLKDKLREVFDDLVSYKKDLRDVIEDEILPDPRVYLWPLQLNSQFPTESIWKNPKAKGRLIECSWASRWNYIKQKSNPVRIYCTEQQYYSDLCSQIDYWKKFYMRTHGQIAKNKWLRLCSDRLKWLSDKKVKYLHQLLPTLLKYRTLTFCNSIEQTELLGEYCINSKNADSVQYLEDFNSGKADHITACNMLNEGMNLVNCQVGIYANLNSSEAIIKQRMGRLLRHPNPVIIVPYYKGTREEELVQTMLEDYNPELVTTISDIKEIKI